MPQAPGLGDGAGEGRESSLPRSGQLTCNRVEIVREVCPERRVSADDDNSYRGSDEAMLDRRDPGLIIEEAAKRISIFKVLSGKTIKISRRSSRARLCTGPAWSGIECRYR